MVRLESVRQFLRVSVSVSDARFRVPRHTVLYTEHRGDVPCFTTFHAFSQVTTKDRSVEVDARALRDLIDEIEQHRGRRIIAHDGVHLPSRLGVSMASRV